MMEHQSLLITHSLRQYIFINTIMESITNNIINSVENRVVEYIIKTIIESIMNANVVLLDVHIYHSCAVTPPE